MSADLTLQYLIYLLLAIFLVLGIRYLYVSIRHRLHDPEEWTQNAATGNMPAELVKAGRSGEDKVRAFNFWFQVNRINKENVPGDFAELGVYKGDSALLIHKLAPDRTIHLFDTFSGFFEPDLSHETGEAATYAWHHFADTDRGLVAEKLSNSKRIIFHEGHFPETTAGLEKVQFAFVHIDADLYLPVRDGLAFFYPRLSPGGVILVHDYTHKWEGLMKAVDDFVRTIPENLVHVPDRHGTVMIIKNKFVD